MQPYNSILSCNRIAVGYKKNLILKEISFKIFPGEIVALLGPNGSGKSTLLKTISKTLAVQKGDIEINGRPLNNIPFSELAKLVAFVPQEEHHLFPFTSREIVLMGRIAYTEGLFESLEDHKAAQHALEICDCTLFADRPITQLSGGEKQRVLIARALAQQAPFILLDEPTTHLDIAHQMDIIRIVKNLAQSGHTILMAMHDLNGAFLLAQRMILLHKGSIEFDANSSEVFHSNALETVYGIQFEKFIDSYGIQRFFPRYS